MAFGTGLVKTAEDFGVQGESPSHPELLDWLADEFIQAGWDVKAILRRIVTSATYRQSSRAVASLRQHDPDNRLLARGPRLRLSAEMVRDQALAASGLLAERLGGPSVKPYQPEGLWRELAETRNTRRTTARTSTAAASTPSGSGPWRRRRWRPSTRRRANSALHRNARQHAASGSHAIERSGLRGGVSRAGRAGNTCNAKSPKSDCAARNVCCVVGREP